MTEGAKCSVREGDSGGLVPTPADPDAADCDIGAVSAVGAKWLARLGRLKMPVGGGLPLTLPMGPVATLLSPEEMDPLAPRWFSMPLLLLVFAMTTSEPVFLPSMRARSRSMRA